MEFKKPSLFNTSNEELWKEAESKYQKGLISKATFESIKEELCIEDYPYEGVSIGNSEVYMKQLLDEALEFKKPSEFATSEEDLLKEAEEKFKNGSISKSTYDSIKNTLTDLNITNLDQELKEIN